LRPHSAGRALLGVEKAQSPARAGWSRSCRGGGDRVSVPSSSAATQVLGFMSSLHASGSPQGSSSLLGKCLPGPSSLNGFIFDVTKPKLLQIVVAGLRTDCCSGSPRRTRCRPDKVRIKQRFRNGSGCSTTRPRGRFLRRIARIRRRDYAQRGINARCVLVFGHDRVPKTGIHF